MVLQKGGHGKPSPAEPVEQPVGVQQKEGQSQWEGRGYWRCG